MVSPYYTGYTAPTPNADEVKNGLIMDWLLKNKKEAGGNSGLLNQYLTAENYGPNMPAVPDSRATSSDDIQKAIALSSQPIQGAPTPTPPKSGGAQNILEQVAAKTNAKYAAQSVPTVMPGIESEAVAKSSLNDLMAKLAAHRQAKSADDQSQVWMNIFSKMATSKDPRLLGVVGEGAGTVAPTIQSQRTANDASYDKSLEDQIALEKYKQSYGLEGRKVGADELRAKAAMAEAGSNATYKSAMAGTLGVGSTKGLSSRLSGLKILYNDSNTSPEERAVIGAQIRQLSLGGSDLTEPSLTAPIDYTQYKK